MAAGHLHVASETALGRFEGLLTHDGWHWHGHPFFRACRLLTLAGTNGLEGGCTTARRRRSRPSALGFFHRGRRSQDATNRGHMLALAASGRRYLSVAEAFGHGL